MCEGPAGTGKTHIAIGMAINMLDAGLFNKILIARPVLEAGEAIGFLPGDADKKLDPYVRPIFDELESYCSFSEIATIRNSKVLEIIPIGFMRGRTFKKSFIIVDECQNAKIDQIKMIMTRLGEGSKMIINGDITQSDLDSRIRGGFEYAFNLCRNVNSIQCIQLTDDDIVRHSVVKEILALWEKGLDKSQMRDKIS